jgi:uncharacterized protein
MARHAVTNFHRLLLLGVIHVVQHPKRVLLITGLVVAICVGFASWKLRMSTDQDQLFSANVPFFHNYIEFTQDFPENQASYVIIQAKDPTHPPPVKRWSDVANAITNRLAKETKFVKAVDSHVPIEQLGAQGLLFEDHALVKQDVAAARDMIELAKRWGETPSLLDRTVFGKTPIERFLAYVQLHANDPQTAQFTQLLADGWNKALADTNRPVTIGDQVPDLSQLGATDPGRLGYYYVPDATDSNNHLLLVRVYERSDYSSMGAFSQVIDGIRDAAGDAAKSFPEFKVGLAGRPVLEADEMMTTDRDSTRAEICALIAVFIGLVLLLRSIWLAVAAEIALLVGIGWTFGWATVSLGELNLLSMVFLIALIGIGMDYLIQVLTRYRREAARHSDPRVIWAGVFKYVAAPINTACLGAAGAFFVSVFTNFRGAAELGIIASGGLLLCLLTGYTVLPALLTIFPAKVRSVVGEDIDRPAINLNSRRSHHLWLILPAIWALLLLAGIPFARQAHFDPSLLNLQAQNLESVKLVRKLQTWSAVVLSKDLDKLRQVRGAVENLQTVASTESLLLAQDNYRWLHDPANALPTINWAAPDAITVGDLPRIAGTARALAGKFRSSAATQPAFAMVAVSLETFATTISNATGPAADRAAAQLSSWQIVFVDELKQMLAVFHPPPLDVNALPATLKDHLVGTDGRFALYIYPKRDLWNQDDLRDFVGQVETATARVPDAPPVTGIAINVYHSTSSIEKSFYHAAGYALALIFVLVLLDLRNIRQTILAISVLAMGLPMLVALMGLLHISWNFANFFGLPILIGAGHEYGVFMVHRYNEACRDPRRMWQRWDVSDRALLLCAFVTTASFGFFWAMGHHQGLKSLGLVMAFGTVCIYLATLCMLRPLLLWKLAHRPPQGMGAPMSPIQNSQSVQSAK